MYIRGIGDFSSPPFKGEPGSASPALSILAQFVFGKTAFQFSLGTPKGAGAGRQIPENFLIPIKFHIKS
jgi:hypothetical protein